MQITRSFDRSEATLVGWGVRTLLLSGDTAGVTERRLAGLGGQVEMVDELFLALDALISDPSGFGLFVMDADVFGGVQAGMRAFHLLGDVARRVPMILISKEIQDQVFPDGTDMPTMLRGPLSAVALRVGFEHALRGRMLLRVA